VRGTAGGRDTGLSFVDIRLAIQGTNPAARPDRELNLDAIVLAMIRRQITRGRRVAKTDALQLDKIDARLEGVEVLDLNSRGSEMCRTELKGVALDDPMKSRTQK
jgi:hypothetical protein